MPIYEYECQKCGHQFEYLILSTTPAPVCPKCKKKDLKQLISLSSVSSASTRQANLKGAQARAAAVRKDKRHEDHKFMHAHFEDHMPPKEKSKKKK